MPITLVIGFQETLPTASVGLGWPVVLVAGVLGAAVGAWIAWRRGRTGADSVALEQLSRQREDLAARLERMKADQAQLEHRRRVLAETIEMLGMQKAELESQTEILARANHELERMEQLSAWQQSELAERNAALERQTTEAERLSSELEQRVAELDAAMRQIDRMYREQESFLRHELGNAIVPIRGYSEMLMAGDGLDARTRERVGMIRQASDRMVELLEVLRDLQAIERGDRPVVRAPIDLDALLRDAVRTADPEGGVTVHLSSSPLEIHGDPTLLPGVFLNLVRNAMEHVVADARERDAPVASIDISLEERSGEAVIGVRNGGPPVAAERLASFFDRFNSTKPGGTGLGTSYARLVVEAHEGSIDVTSSVEHGTHVTVRLPISSEPAMWRA